MEDETQKSVAPAPPAPAGRDRSTRLREACRLIFLIFALWVAATCQAADAYDAVLDKQLAADPNVTALEKALLSEGKMRAQAPDDEPPPPSSTYYGVVVGFALVFAGVVAFLNWRFNPLKLFRAPTAAHLQLPVEDPALAAFFNELRDGLKAFAHQPVTPVIDSLNSDQPLMATESVETFIDSAPSRIADFRALFSKISRAPDADARQTSLVEFADQVRSLKDHARTPALHPVWLLASALEGLLLQLSRKASDFTPSVQRTAASAVDLLEALCVRGLDPNLATEPHIRILAVDDDAVSRLAISLALKKAFNDPTLASEGETALDMAVQHAYDVIFLDVEMPGMNGFELCKRIHETLRNRATPVVFVTGHSDFNSRAKSTISGGVDLIGKPFLTFEITVKALTLALRGRLQKATEPGSAKNEGNGETAPVKAAIGAEAPGAISAFRQTKVAAQARELSAKRDADADVASNTVRTSQQDAPKLSQDCGADVFFNQTLSHLDGLRNQLEAVRHAVAPAELQKSLSQLFIGVHSLSSGAERAELSAIFKLSSALEGMLMKLLKQTKFCSPSILDATGAALELLEDLCLSEMNPDLAHPPIRLLVVDDDPVACRAVSGSLQLAFGRPESADSGEAALALAAETPFDLIFLDLLMPGMDGFTTCARIHETASNSRTPIVFVTNHDDTAARSQAAAAGGCGFIPKPVLPSQITLTALTFILRARLDELEPIHTVEEPASLTIA